MSKGLMFSSIASLFLMSYSIFLTPVCLNFLISTKCILIEWSIFQMSSCDVSFILVIDSLSLSFSLAVALISSCVMLFSSSYMASDVFSKRFTFLVLLFILSMNFLIFIPSLPCLLLGWDGLGIVSYILVIYYQNWKSLSAGTITILMNRVGDVLILVGIGLLVVQGHWTIMLMWSFEHMYLVGLLIMVAGMTKSAQIPFSSWLPAAMAAPTPVSALVHSSTLVTAGVYLIIRFYSLLSSTPFFNNSLFFISVMTLLMAGVGANCEYDLKKIIALSTLSQLGVMMMSLGLGFPGLALFHLFTHALFKAMLFLCAGSMIHSSVGTQDIRYMGFFYYQSPIVVCCMNIANLSLCGFPFLSGFYSKDLILEMCMYSNSSIIMSFLVFLATGMTAGYSLRLSLCSVWGSPKNYSFHPKSSLDPYMDFSIMILSGFSVVSGMALQVVFLYFDIFPIIIPFHYKFLSIFVFFVGLFFSLMIFYEDFKEFKLKKISYFLSGMWFLSSLSSEPISKNTFKLSEFILKSVDYGWLEILGGQGAFKVVSIGSLWNQKVQILLFNVFIMLMVSVSFLFAFF